VIDRSGHNLGRWWDWRSALVFPEKYEEIGWGHMVFVLSEETAAQ
jgi:hypothetical protein